MTNPAKTRFEEAYAKRQDPIGLGNTIDYEAALWGFILGLRHASTIATLFADAAIDRIETDGYSIADELTRTADELERGSE